MHNLINENIIFFKIKNYKKGNVIYNEKEECKTINFILDGEVIISTSTFNNKEEIINKLHKGECFGDVLIFTSKPYYLGNVICLQNTKIATITKRDFINLCSINTDFLNLFLNNLCEKSIKSRFQSKLLCHKNIRDRIIFYLEKQADLYNSKFINIVSVENLSKILSLPRPSVSRELINMQKDNLIVKNKNIIEILF